MELHHNMEALRIASESLQQQYADQACQLAAFADEQRKLREAKQTQELIRSIKPFVKHAIRTDATKAAFILSTAAWIEGLVNIVLTLRLDAEQFAAVDSLSPIDKWTVVVPLLVPAFQISRDAQAYQALKELIYDRNALTHSKPQAKDEKNVLHKGKSPKYSVGKLEEVRAKIEAWEALPRQLIQLLKEADKGLGEAVWLHSGYWMEEIEQEFVTAGLEHDV